MSNHRNRDLQKRKGIGKFFLAILINLFLYLTYFYFLVRGALSDLIRRQEALEQLKALTVPGVAFLEKLDTLFVFKSSLFFLVPIGLLLIAFLCLSLMFASRMIRGLFLLSGLIAIGILTYHDRIWTSLVLTVSISFASFFLLTRSNDIRFEWKESLTLLIMAGLVTAALLYGSHAGFFLKARDRFFMDSPWGKKVSEYYYTYSPLAVSVISPPIAIYEGLIFNEGNQTESYDYYGNGLFLTGNKKVKHSADFVIRHQNGKRLMSDRYGQTTPLRSLDPAEISRAVRNLSGTHGFMMLNKICLYALPASILVVILFMAKGFSRDPKVVIVLSIGIALAVLSLIGYVTLKDSYSPEEDDLTAESIQKHGLAIAYHLQDYKEIPQRYEPLIKKMVQSESTALRFWGTRFLGRLPDKTNFPYLFGLIEDPSLNVRYAAAQSLYDMLGKKSLKPLFARLLTDPNWYVRCTIFTVFLKAGVIPRPA
jgi:hypothetical protein